MARFEIVGERDADLDFFDRQRRIAWWNQDALRNARILVVGAGAIGNEVLKNLALLGVGYLLVADFDEVSTSNLSRTVLFRPGDVGSLKARVAAERARALCLDSDARVDWFHGDVAWELGAGVFRRVDLVLGCLDNAETRFAVNRLCWLTGTPWIDAGISELAVRVNVYVPPLPPCHECGASAAQLAAVRQRYSCEDFKRRSYDAGRVATVQIAAALVGALQTQEAVKLLCGQSAAVGARLHYQGTRHDFDVVPLQEKPGCQAHATYPAVESLPLSNRAKLRELLEYVVDAGRAGPGAALVLYDRTFVTDFPCLRCGTAIRFDRPTFRIFDDEAHCSACCAGEEPAQQREPAREERLGRFTLDETPPRLLDLTLEALGIPARHVVSIQGGNGDFTWYELSADEARVLPGLAGAPPRAATGTDGWTVRAPTDDAPVPHPLQANPTPA